MQSKPKILVLKMRELIYTGIFLFLAIVLIVLLILMFRSEKRPKSRLRSLRNDTPPVSILPL
ncbi:MAG: hypothetical protein ACLR6B_07630 [Blautia sp.]